MFNKLNELLSKLKLEDPSNYVQCKNARKILQDIKVESQKLRNKITSDFKDYKSGKIKYVGEEKIIENEKQDNEEIKEEIEEEPIRTIEEDDEEFFDKQ